MCLSPSGLLCQNTTDLVAYKQQKSLSPALEAGSARSRCQHGPVREWLFQFADFCCILAWERGKDAQGPLS